MQQHETVPLVVELGLLRGNDMNLLHFEAYGPKNDDGYNVMYEASMKHLGHIYKEVDGFYVFQPNLAGGCWGDEVLRELSGYLLALNFEWKLFVEGELKGEERGHLDGGDSLLTNC